MTAPTLPIEPIIREGWDVCLCADGRHLSASMAGGVLTRDEADLILQRWDRDGVSTMHLIHHTVTAVER